MNFFWLIYSADAEFFCSIHKVFNITVNKLSVFIGRKIDYHNIISLFKNTVICDDDTAE